MGRNTRQGKTPARSPKVTRRQRTTSAGPKGSLRRTTPPAQNRKR